MPTVLRIAGLPDDSEITMFSQQDPLDQMIYGENLRIQALHFHPDLDLWLIVLNNGKLLKRKLSSYLRLAKAEISDLEKIEYIGGGTGIHWPNLDEDLSLRGFLQEEILRLSQSLVA